MSYEANPESGALTEAQSEASIIERIQNARSKPTEPTEIVEDTTAEQEPAPEVEAVELEPSESDDIEQHEETETDTEETPTYTVKVSGEEKAVTLDELQKGYSMEADYRQKTTALAEQRKAFETEQTAKFEKLDGNINSLEALLKASEENIDWDNLREYDTAEYLRLKDQKQEREAALVKAKADRDGEMQTQQKAYIEQEVKALNQAIPEWNDATVKARDMEAIGNVLNMVNIRPDELQDHRQFLVLNMAAKYLDMQSKSNATAKEIKTTPKTIKPKAGQRKSPVADIDKAKANYRKSGSETDLLDIFKQKLGNK